MNVNFAKKYTLAVTVVLGFYSNFAYGAPRIYSNWSGSHQPQVGASMAATPRLKNTSKMPIYGFYNGYAQFDGFRMKFKDVDSCENVWKSASSFFIDAQLDGKPQDVLYSWYMMDECDKLKDGSFSSWFVFTISSLSEAGVLLVEDYVKERTGKMLMGIEVNFKKGISISVPESFHVSYKETETDKFSKTLIAKKIRNFESWNEIYLDSEHFQTIVATGKKVDFMDYIKLNYFESDAVAVENSLGKADGFRLDLWTPIINFEDGAAVISFVVPQDLPIYTCKYGECF